MRAVQIIVKVGDDHDDDNGSVADGEEHGDDGDRRLEGRPAGVQEGGVQEGGRGRRDGRRS